MTDRFINIQDNAGTTYQQRLKDNLDGTFSPGMSVEGSGQPSLGRQVAATTTSADTELTATVLRISIKARTADLRYAIGTEVQTASDTTGNFIGAGERLDLSIPAGCHIAVIRDAAATVDGILEISELS